MTGPEHYTAAEELLQQKNLENWPPAERLELMLRAQTHAMLALTAVHAFPPSGTHDTREWRRVASDIYERRN